MAELVREKSKQKRNRRNKTKGTSKDEVLQSDKVLEKELPLDAESNISASGQCNQVDSVSESEEFGNNLIVENERRKFELYEQRSKTLSDGDTIAENLIEHDLHMEYVDACQSIDLKRKEVHNIDTSTWPGSDGSLISNDIVNRQERDASNCVMNDEKLLTVTDDKIDIKIPSAPLPSLASITTATSPYFEEEVVNPGERYVSDQPGSSPYANLKRQLNRIDALTKLEMDVVLEPFTEEQLNSFYCNLELKQLVFYIEEFLKNSQINGIFRDLVESYYKSKLKLVEVEEKIKDLQKNVQKERKEVWMISQCTHTALGVCGCGVKVKQEHKYQQAKYNKSKLKKINDDLIILRGFMYDTRQLESYNSQTAKIRIENYLYQLFHVNSALKNIKVHQPVSVLLPHDLEPNIYPVLQQLRDCISVLFAFKRLGCLEGEFSEDLQKWLDLLVAALQRIGTLQDSFFLLNHILRCPQGVVYSLAHYIQFPPFGHKLPANLLNKPEVHHFIIMIATLTHPVRSRKEFLAKSNKNIESTSTDGTDWTFLDENYEEEENSEDSWVLMSEHDLTGIFQQFPFEELLVAFLHLDDCGDISASSPDVQSGDMMQIFAFFSCLLDILGDICKMYNLLRYREFIKVITCTIRSITRAVSDYWLSYRQYCLDVLGVTYDTEPVRSNYTQYSFSLRRLQVEYDQFLSKACKRIISSGSSGALQFLSTMPFEAISSTALWALMHLAIKKLDLSPISMEDLKDMYTRMFNVSPNERKYLLTVLSNMAICRDETDRQFIETVARLVIEGAFLNTSFEESFPENGRKMLNLMVDKHTFLISSLLNYDDSFIEQFEKFLVYIFEFFPIQSWRPTVPDMEKLRSWLLQKPLIAEQNKLARNLLSKLNYGFDENGTQLFLPRNFHFMIAILLVEAYGIAFPDYPGGIKDPNYDEMGIFQQVGQIAVSSYTKLVSSQLHSAFVSWSWKVMLMLKLHISDVPSNFSDSTCSAPTEIDDDTASWCSKTLSKLKDKQSYELDLKETQELLYVHLSVQSKGLLAAYVAFAMTKDGHFMELIILNGLQHMILLKNAALYDPVLRIVSNVARIFMHNPESILNESFINTLTTLIHIDVKNSGYTEKLWEYFVAGTYSQTLASLVLTHIGETKRSSSEDALCAIKYWITLFVKLPAWSSDCSILYQVDCLCKIAFTVNNGMETLLDVFYGQFKELIVTQQSRGYFSSVISWITNNHVVSLMPSTTRDFCYYAYAALCIEMKYVQEIGLDAALGTCMVMNPTLTVMQAYKMVVPSIQATYVPPINALSIYRWADQALVTPYDHPFLPIIWQQFFQLYFKKPSESSGLPSRVGIGMHFFDETNVALKKKMKNTLYNLAKHHQDKSTLDDFLCKQDDSSTVYNELGNERAYSSAFHDNLARFYQCLALWLEESRLHDSNLFLNSLPDAYNPDLLLKIFQANKGLWQEFIDSSSLKKDLDMMSIMWKNYFFCPAATLTKPISKSERETNAERYISTLSLKGNEARPPPKVVHPQQSVPGISLHVLTQQSLIQVIENDLQEMAKFARTLSDLQATQVALDSEFLEELPKLYENVHRKLIVGIPCLGKKNPKSGGVCTNPAEVTIEFTELHLIERIYNMVEKNRMLFDDIILRCSLPIFDPLCHKVIWMENIIHKLSETFDVLKPTERVDLQDRARHLFYSFAELIDSNVKRCPPAIQFFSSGVEQLGKKFIADNESEQTSLLETILKQDQSVMFLAPFFTPMSSVDCFVKLYRNVLSFVKEDHATTVFVLLTKFDLNVWTHSLPTLSDKISVSMLIMNALNRIGPKPNTEMLVILEVIRSHMTILLNSDINEFFNKMLVEFLNNSSKSSIAVVCWEDLVSCLGYDKDGLSDLLNIGQVKESIQFLATHFLNNLERYEYQLDEMFEVWEPYVGPLNQLLFGLFRQVIHHMASKKDSCEKENLIREFWELIISIYHPWLIPRTSGKIWSLLRIHSVSSVLKSFVDTLRFAIDFFKDDGCCKILNYVWTYYFQFIIQVVKEEQSLDIFHYHFASLPWRLYCPTVQELDFVLQTSGSHPNAFRFYGSVVSDIDWSMVVTCYSILNEIEITSHLHQKLFHILVMMAADKTILEELSSKLTYLFKTAKAFQWNLLGLEDTGHVLQWYAENVDPTSILLRESFLYTTLDLSLHVCGFSSEYDNLDELSKQRRNLYIQTVVTILARCSSLKYCVYDFRYATEKLLETIESIIIYNKVNPLEELVMHVSSILNLLNLITNLQIHELFMATLESYLLSTGCGMIVLAVISATSMSVANIQQMVLLLEKSISCYFMRLSDGELQHSWSPVISAFMVPELELDDFIEEALKQKAILTLYTYSIHRMSKSDEPNHYLDILFDIVQWCTKMQPDKGSDTKFLLLWLQVFNIVLALTPDADAQQLSKYMMFLSNSCQSQGEEKVYDGVLGMIGIGRRNPLSKEFRITANAVHLFLLYKLPTSKLAQHVLPNAPDAIQKCTDESSAPASEAEEFFHAFRGLLTNKSYSTLHTHVNWVLEFLSDPHTCIRDGRTLIVYLCKAFFEKENFIVASVI